ncbi:VIT and VWA domain-containing protein [Neptuniibacter sp. 2_MG-2023]|uniref:VIT and vWA domain-containing protein n=1 Tax=Neptuniibacter sp. 2_MG-2023 TaxID=3062671 RepID=UPI0026E159A7|nr:VIT and VWA domain-containing protein [Neptuniibacter sp. 2_MG-2023]MDO6514333.1 VIT and VWA domain-containing protein [Neptuniibacter sp. 2_MG-2023]
MTNLTSTHKTALLTALGLSFGLSSSLFYSPSIEAAGLLKPHNANYTDLQIKEHHVNVVIEDMYATTTIEQTFHNPNSNDLEAIYSFPVPEKAAVGEFSYWIDGKPVTGEVVEKQQARQIYEQQKAQGNETALVEKDKYKTFDISVFPVKANQDVKIKLVYLQNTQTDTGIGRYVYPLEDGGVDVEKHSFWSRNETVEEAFTFNVKLRTSYPVDGLRMPQHPNAQLQQVAPYEWQAALINQTATQVHNRIDHTISPDLETPDTNTPTHLDLNDETDTKTLNQPTTLTQLNKDILLYWRQAEGLPASVDMISYKEANNSKGTFKLTLTPGTDLPLVTQGRDWVFVLDISGSMQGKFSSLVEGVRQGLGQLPPQDRFKVVLFNNQAQNFTQGYQPADKQTIKRVMTQLDNVQPGNGTNLYAGLKNGIDQLDSDRSTAIILVTDGVANVGETEKSKFLNLLEKRDARLFTFIMGNSANRPLLEEMTRVSNGFAMSISNADDIMGQLMLAKGKMSHAAMRDVSLKVSGVRSKEIVKPRLVNTLYHGQQLTVFGHYYQPGEAEITLTGTVNGKEKSYKTRFMLPEQSTQHPELERLWAYAAIEELQAKIDYLGTDKDAEQAITDTAIEYGLVTDYTSMIVVRDEVFKALNIQRNNQQRVEKEQKARELRAQQPVTAQQNRVDQQQPMFIDSSSAQPNQSQQRASVSPSRSGSGGGAISPWLVILMAASIALVQLSRSHSNRSKDV